MVKIPPKMSSKFYPSLNMQIHSSCDKVLLKLVEAKKSKSAFLMVKKWWVTLWAILQIGRDFF
jgi:hypothetical protein